MTEFQGLGAFSSDITKPVCNWALAPKVMNFLSRRTAKSRLK